MKNNKKISIILIALFIVFIAYFWTLFPFTVKNADTSSEKRELSAFPEFTIKNYKNISAQFTSYLKDRIPFRIEITNKYNNIMVNVFNRVPDKGVILGKKNWLFYNSNAKDPQTDEVADYMGKSKYSDEQLSHALETPSLYASISESRGSKFLLAITPNKSSVYGQYMPSSYKVVDEKTRVDQLYEYYKENLPCDVIYLKEDMRKYAKDYKVYFTNDTHWNGLGAFFASNILADHLGLDHPTLDDVELIPENSPEDLKLMLGSSDYPADKDNYIPDYSKIYSAEATYSDENITKYVTSNKNGKKLLLLGDSFSERMDAALMASVEEFHISRTGYIPEDETYDYIVYEIVERNLAFWTY